MNTSETNTQAETTTELTSGIWCLVANVRRERLRPGESGDGGEIITQVTKMFPPGARVFVAKATWGDGWEDCRVIGKSRSGKWIMAVVRRSRLENFRPKFEYSPAAQQAIARSTEPEFRFEDKNEAFHWAESANQRNGTVQIEDVRRAYEPSIQRTEY